MIRYLRLSLSSLLIICLMFALSVFVMAADRLVTTDTVNFRSDMSLDADVITSVVEGDSVEILEHDPAGWSKAVVNDQIGYIKSEFLTIPPGEQPVKFKTIDGVNLRAAPSMDAEILSGFSVGDTVDIVEHDPLGWSKTVTGGTPGYINSAFLAFLTTQSAAAAPAAQTPAEPAETAVPAETPVQSPPAGAAGVQNTLKTIDGVNIRSDPSTDASIIKTLNADSDVSVLEQNSDGWSKVLIGDSIGYIRSDLLNVSGRNVELLEYSEVKGLIKTGEPMLVIDVRTGRSYSITCFCVYDHADVEPTTLADTEIMYDIRDGVRSWSARPVWVSIGGRLIAASMHGMPHDVSWIPDNGMDGHLCLHFYGSTTSSSSQSYKNDLQNAVMEAWNAR